MPTKTKSDKKKTVKKIGPVTLVKRWLDDLRSGKFKQTRARLSFEGKHCCLGVACKIAREKGIISTYDQESSYPDPAVTSAFGFIDSHTAGFVPAQYGVDDAETVGTCKLADLNDDDCRSFKEIAERVRRNPDKYFIPKVAKALKRADIKNYGKEKKNK